MRVESTKKHISQYYSAKKLDHIWYESPESDTI